MRETGTWRVRLRDISHPYGSKCHPPRAAERRRRPGTAHSLSLIAAVRPAADERALPHHDIQRLEHRHGDEHRRRDEHEHEQAEAHRAALVDALDLTLA